MKVVPAFLAVMCLSAASQAPQDRVPVVVELFTSEGCSSCPPADALLSRLAHDQPLAGVQIVPLGLHVTYWDQLGWKDAASLSEATSRQQDYSRVFGEDRVYTPQAVVDGRDELVGSDEAGIRRAVLRAAGQPHARVSLAAHVDAANTVQADVSVTNVPADVKEKLRTILFLTEDGVTTTVKRGENGGRTLHHDALVRRLSTSFSIPARPEWSRARLHVVAVVQGERSQRVIGAAIAAIQ
jgi:hypothetical protein